jgi:hypothetical protein
MIAIQAGGKQMTDIRLMMGNPTVQTTENPVAQNSM